MQSILTTNMDWFLIKYVNARYILICHKCVKRSKLRDLKAQVSALDAQPNIEQSLLHYWQNLVFLKGSFFWKVLEWQDAMMCQIKIFYWSMVLIIL